MKTAVAICAILVVASCSASRSTSPGSPKNLKTGAWIRLFDGHSLNGWRVNENDSTFSIEEGSIKVNGKISHLFYDGGVNNNEFKNFEFRARVKTTKGSNSGIYFHTAFKPKGFPSKGYEVQVNNSHTDWRRTGSLYAVQDVREVYVQDDVWFTESIKVIGKRIVISINDKVVVDYTEPDGIETTKGRAEKHLGTGTFALQGHDPNSKIFFKEIFVKILPE